MTPKTAPRKEGEEYGDQVLSKTVKAGRRTYFFDVRATRADDYFITITEEPEARRRRRADELRPAQDLSLQGGFRQVRRRLLEAIQFIRTSKPESVVEREPIAEKA